MAKADELYLFDEDTKNNWWILVVSGLLSVIFGFVAVIWPQITVGVLALLLAVFIGISGVADIVRGIKRLSDNVFFSILTLLLGLLEVGVSLYLLSNVGSGLAIATLALLIAITFLVRGLFLIVLAFSDPDYKATRWLNVFMGALSLIAGLIVVWWPGAATLAWVWVIGLYAIVAGAIQIGLGFTAKDIARK